jgi:H+/Cl- antiporter ClcA
LSEAQRLPVVSWWRTPLRWWGQHFAQRQERVLLALSILIGALTGLAVVAFILLTERLGMRLYPAGSAAWRRVLIPIAGSLGMGYLLFRFFPDARGSGVPQTKAALYARGGVITLRTIVGKFFCTAATLASGIPLGREGPSVQVGGGIASVLGRRLGLRPENVKALIRGNRRRSQRAGAGFGGAGVGNLLARPASVAGQQPVISGAAIPTGSSGRACGLCGARSGRRLCLRGVHQISAGNA